MTGARLKAFGLILMTLVVFFPSLLNGFSGDDAYFLSENTFYDHPRNIARLFQRDYNVDSRDYFLQDLRDKGTGSVAYRPVLSLTYFGDTAIWRHHAFGFHLTNLFLHLANVLLVYLFLTRFFPEAAWLGAGLFAIHPIQTEAVCAIGYRGDLLACFWILVALWCWRLFREQSLRRYAVGSAVAYFLGVFTKESAVPFALMLPIYDLLVADNGGRRIRPLRDYAMHGVVLIIYLYVYFMVFPNTALSSLSHSSHSSVTLLPLFAIWGGYLADLLWPFRLSLLPPFYSPDLSSGLWGVVILPAILTSGFLGGLVYLFQRDKKLAFLMIWYVAFYMPVSGLVPIPNPMAYRFVYLPVVGLLPTLAVLLSRAVRIMPKGSLWERLSRLCGVILLASLAFCSFTTTFLWHDNLSIARVWVERFPANYKGYEILAKEYYRRGFYEKAAPYYSQTLSLDNPNPTNYYEFGQCLLKTGRVDESFGPFQQVVRLYPNYANGHFGMGRVYKSKGQYGQAIASFRRALDLAAHKDVAYYFQVIDCYRKDGQTAQADQMLHEAEKALSAEDYLRLLPPALRPMRPLPQ